MDRKEFLSSMGSGAAGLLLLSCFSACTKSSGAPASTDFMVDLNAAGSVNLKTPGGFIYMNGVIVAQTLSGQYIAVTQACTHEGATVTYDKNADHFYCPSHGSVFSDSGAVINGPAGSPLKEYNVSVSGSTLHVYL